MSSETTLQKLKKYISEDRPKRLRSYAKKHKIVLSDVQLKNGQNLLHYCCKHGSGSMLRYLLREGVECYHGDRERDSAFHSALKRALTLERAGQHGEASDCYTGLILPLIQRWPGLLEVTDKSGVSGRRLLHTLVQCREGTQTGNHGTETQSEPREPGEMDDREWRDKLADEVQHEYNTQWGGYENDYTEMYGEQETYDDWADRIRSQYQNKKRAERLASEYVSQAKKQKTSHNPKTQAGPDNLEDIRKDMRRKYDRTKEVDNEAKILKRRMKYEVRYKESLERGERDRLKYDDVPWPSVDGPENDMKVLFEGMDPSGADYKKYLRDQQIRWHPDKFQQRFGEVLDESERDRILQRVTVLSQQLNKVVK